eukprot:TRINITY_DN20444_c0_g1_i1.p1 TRINITY_DN20444_c0_g1~~TRINITY_DN20444_c0_g1_i1.p1  ORF type:complete len:618 (+),score=247.84 TRINITY_DN20444_c0_g1_i1:48-1901(+)
MAESEEGAPPGEGLVRELRSVAAACGGSIPLASFFLHKPELKKKLGDKKLKDYVEEHPEEFELVDVKRKDGESKAFGGQGLVLRLVAPAGAGDAAGAALDSTPVGRTALGVLEKVLVSEMKRVDSPTPHPRVSFMSFNYKVRKKLRSAYTLAPNPEVVNLFPTPGADASEEAARTRSLFSMYLLRFAESRPKVFRVTDGEKDPSCDTYHIAEGRCGCNTFLELVEEASEATQATADDTKRNEVLEQRLLALLRDVNPKKGVDLAWLGQDNKVRKVLHGRALLVVLRTLPTFVLEQRDDRWLVKVSPAHVEARRAAAADAAPAKRRKTEGEGYAHGGGVELEIIGEANGLVCLAKQPNVSTEALIHTLKKQRAARDAVPDGEEVISISRLDKETSGVVPVALSAASEAHMKQQYATHAVGKRYAALCAGFAPAAGRVESKLLLSDTPGNNRVRVHKNGKLSTTEYKAVGRYRRVASTPELRALMGALHLHRGVAKDLVAGILAFHLPPCGKADKFTLLSVTPLTGRTHQIRVHMMSQGHPLAADFKYGKEAAVKKQSKWCPRNFLHCEMVEGVDCEGKDFHFAAPLPADMRRVLSHQLVAMPDVPPAPVTPKAAPSSR